MPDNPIVPSLDKILPKRRKQLHQSGVEMIGKCGIMFEKRYLQGLKRKPNAFLLCGTATDKAVGTDLDHKIDTGELENESVLLDVARDTIEHYPDKEEIELDDDEKDKSVNDVLGETKDKAVRLVKAHHSEVAPTIRPIATAKRFAVDLDPFLRKRAKALRDKMDTVSPSVAKVLNQQARYLNVAARNGLDFVGEFDIVEKWQEISEVPESEVSIIRDTKTSKKSPTETMADESHQLSAYSVAHHVLYGDLPDAVKLDYLVDLKSGVKTVTLTSHRDEEDVDKYLNRLVSAVVQMESGIFVPAPNTAWWCADRWCAYHSHCDYVKHRVTSIPELVQIKTSTGDAA